jgi:hypothetical protein
LVSVAAVAESDVVGRKAVLPGAKARAEGAATRKAAVAIFMAGMGLRKNDVCEEDDRKYDRGV